MSTAPNIVAEPEHIIRQTVITAHLARWLADYWRTRGNPLSSSRRARAGQRSKERGETAEGAFGWKR